MGDMGEWREWREWDRGRERRETADRGETETTRPRARPRAKGRGTGRTGLTSPIGLLLALAAALALARAAPAGGDAPAPSEAPAEPTAAVQRILRRSEFRGAEPSTVTVFYHWCLYRIRYWWSSSASSPTTLTAQTALSWALACLTVFVAAVLVLSTWRLLRRRGPAPPRASADALVVTERVLLPDPDAHAGRARDMAREGRYRLAVRETLWAALSALESGGIVRPARFLTNWEYVSAARGRLSDPSAEALRALCRAFDVVWYGGAPCDRARYEECAGALSAFREGLGH